MSIIGRLNYPVLTLFILYCQLLGYRNIREKRLPLFHFSQWQYVLKSL